MPTRSTAALLLLLSLPLQADPRQAPAPVAGLMDLRGWDPAEGGLIVLRGEWEYVDRMLLSPWEYPPAGDPSIAPRTVPSRWPNGESGYPFSYGTYRCRVLVPPGRTYALQIQNQDTAHRFFLDGALVASDGQVGADRAASVPSRRIRYHYWTEEDGSFEIVLQVSNFHHYKGGPGNAIRLGRPEDMNARRLWTVVFSFFLLGCFLTMGLYCLNKFLFRRERTANFWFFLICGTFGLRSLVIGDADLSLFFPSVGWIVLTRGGFLLEALLFPLFLLYTGSLFPDVLPRPLRLSLLGLSVLIVGATAGAVPLEFYAKYVHAPFNWMLYLLAGALAFQLFWVRIRGNRDALGFGISYLILLAVILDSSLLFRFLPDANYEALTVAALAFAVCQSFLLSRQDAAAYRKLDVLSESLERQILERTAELETANGALQRRNAERDFFLMSLSHEVKTPMTIILNLLDRARRRHPTDRDLASVKANLDRIFRDMVDIFDFLRMERGKPIGSARVRLDVARELRGLASFYRPLLAEAGLKLSVRTEKGLFLDGDPDAFRRMCGNYMENAAKYAARGGRVVLGARRVEGRIVVRVEDSGPAVDPADAALLFEPFRQLKSGKGGAGLGLPLVKEFARLAGGTAGLEIVDGWNSFYIDLPAAEREAPREPGDRAASGRQRKRARRKAGKERLVLLVEDRAEIRALQVQALHPRFLVRTARGGREALGLLAGGLSPDLIVSDVMMDGVDGFAMLRALDAERRDVPVLFVTAMSNAAERMPPSPGRTVRVLVKPFSERSLRDAVEDILEAAAPRSAKRPSR